MEQAGTAFNRAGLRHIPGESRLWKYQEAGSAILFYRYGHVQVAFFGHCYCNAGDLMALILRCTGYNPNLYQQYVYLATDIGRSDFWLCVGGAMSGHLVRGCIAIVAFWFAGRVEERLNKLSSGSS